MRAPNDGPPATDPLTSDGFVLEEDLALVAIGARVSDFVWREEGAAMHGQHGRDRARSARIRALQLELAALARPRRPRRPLGHTA